MITKNAKFRTLSGLTWLVQQPAEAPRRAYCGNGASMIDVDVISADHGTRHEVEKKTCEISKDMSHVRDLT